MRSRVGKNKKLVDSSDARNHQEIRDWVGEREREREREWERE